jgi:hypothetical protein
MMTPESNHGDAVMARFANSLAYHQVSQRRAMSRTPGRVTAYFLWAGWLAYLVIFLLGMDPRTMFGWSWLMNAALLILGFLIAFNATPAVAVRRMRPMALLTDAPIVWRFATNRVACDIGTWEHRDFAWEALNGVDILADGFFIVPNPRMCHWVPKSAFESEQDYEQVLSWARGKARSIRQFGGVRMAEWLVSLALVPFALPLPLTAIELFSAAGFSDDPAATASIFYTGMTPHYFAGYWILAATVFVVFHRRKVRALLPHAGLALLLGLAWDGFTPAGFAGNLPDWIASTCAWLFAGCAHWWIVVRAPYDD